MNSTQHSSADIDIEGARTHNLKNLSLKIPRNQFVVITGPSGSGKSSLAFDTIFAEGQRQYLESLSPHTRQFFRQLDRPDVDRITGLPPTIAVDQRGRTANARSTVGTLSEVYDFLRLLYARCGIVHCYQCGRPIQQTPPTRIIDSLMTLPENTRLMLLAPIIRQQEIDQDELFTQIIKSGFFRVRVDGQLCDLDPPPKYDAKLPHDVEIVIDRLIIKKEIGNEECRQRLAESLGLALKHGDDSVIAVYETERDRWHDLPFSVQYACSHCRIRYTELEPRTFSFNSPYGACPHCEGKGCEACHGTRLRCEARSVTVADKRIDEVCAMTLEEAHVFFQTCEWTPDYQAITKPIMEQIVPRLNFLCQLGLSYLTLSRPADTLSGGELQRVRLATGLGSGMTGVCYVLDEPTIGLHPRDNFRLIKALRTLQQSGNTVLVVEHDESVMQEADYRIEIGPGSGCFGGELVIVGKQTVNDDNPSHDCKIANRGMSNMSAIKGEGAALTLENVNTHNLKNVTVSFPLQKLICVTGVSGSGKSSLIIETLVPLIRDHLQRRPFSLPCMLKGAEQIDKLVEVDQTLGKSVRSNPATYSGLFDELRKLFASTKDAKRRGYKANRFSFNVGSGRCEACQGQGVQKIESEFLNDYTMICPACQGKRFNRQTLAVKYKSKSIADVLDMSIEEASGFFENIPTINRILKAMQQIGLGYLTLGQPSSTLSGGEAQRVKLATELAKPETGKTLYVLDEPTTGLHRSDVFHLIDVLSELARKGNTVVVIEHNLDVMSHSDWLIDLGPEGGKQGGSILAEGLPKDIAQLKDNITGTFLNAVFR